MTKFILFLQGNFLPRRLQRWAQSISADGEKGGEALPQLLRQSPQDWE
jgi:hypothetical protein